MLKRLVNTLFGCTHKKLTRPITPIRRPPEPCATYVACLDCGKKFHYDPQTMRVGAAMPRDPASPHAIVFPLKQRTRP